MAKKKKMLELKKVKVDWLKMINLAFDRKDWGKKHTLHVYGEVSVSVVMTKFLFGENKAIFKLTCDYPQDNHHPYWISSDEVGYSLNHYEPGFFNKLMIKRTITFLMELIKKRTEDFAEENFQNMKHYSFNMSLEDAEKYGFEDSWREISLITDEDVRELALDSLKEMIRDEANIPYENAIIEFVESNKCCPPNMIKLLDGIREHLEEMEED